MSDEKWIKYDEVEIPEDNYALIKVLQGENGTEISLKGTNNNLILKFGFVDVLRVSDEGRRIRTYQETQEIQEYRKNFFGNPIYRIECSELLEWVSNESCGFYTDMTHYVIVTMDDIVDIISSEKPEIYLEIV